MVFAPNTKEQLSAAIDDWIAGNINSNSSVPNGQGTGSYGDMNAWIVTGPEGARITDMKSLFEGKTPFNDDITGWDVSNVTNMRQMFLGATTFNQDLSGWDVSNVTNPRYMFQNATAFNNGGQPLSWGTKTSKFWKTNGMFKDAVNFNQDVGDWDVSSVIEMDEMFRESDSFNRDLSGWERQNGVNGATSTSTMANVTRMHIFFRDNHNGFNNLSIRAWKISSSCSLSNFFMGANTFRDNYLGYPGYSSDQDTPSYTFFNQNPATYSLNYAYDSPNAGEATVIGITSAGGGSTYSGSIVIQDTVVNGGNTYNVTAINTDAFKDYANLTDISIPHMVTSIGDTALSNCTSLHSVIFKHHSSTPTITFGNTIFSGSSPLTNLGIYQSPTTLGGTVYTVGDTNANLSGGTFANVVLESNICFPAGTILSLDQGDIEIQNVDTKIHTLNGKPILFVTKTKPSKSDMVCFEKDAFAPNVPSQRFECSRAHGIEFEGVCKMAEDWVDADQIHFVPNTHQILYCLLLKTHEMIDVYNIRAETLNPVRKVAQIYFAQLKNEKETC